MRRSAHICSLHCCLPQVICVPTTRLLLLLLLWWERTALRARSAGRHPHQNNRQGVSFKKLRNDWFHEEFGLTLQSSGRVAFYLHLCDFTQQKLLSFKFLWYSTTSSAHFCTWIHVKIWILILNIFILSHHTHSLPVVHIWIYFQFLPFQSTKFLRTEFISLTSLT